MYKRLNITLSEDVIAHADEFARRERYTRSGLIAAALEAFVSGGGAGATATGSASLAAEAPAAYAAMTEPVSDLSLERVGDVLRVFFAARDDVEAAWVFGSVARATTGPMSDVDVAVLPARQLDADARWGLRRDLMSRLPGVLGARAVDVAVLPDVAVRLGFEIADEGVVVFGQDSRAAAEWAIAAIGAYWDYAPLLTEAQDALGERMRAYAEGE